jgi:hypothetical protein
LLAAALVLRILSPPHYRWVRLGSPSYQPIRPWAFGPALRFRQRGELVFRIAIANLFCSKQLAKKKDHFARIRVKLVSPLIRCKGEMQRDGISPNEIEVAY